GIERLSTPLAPFDTVRLRAGMTVPRALERLRSRRSVAWAVPDYIAHAAGMASASSGPPPAGGALGLANTTAAPAPFIPNDPGSAHTPGGWQQLQWNFDGAYGVNAPQAWANLVAAGHPGGKGVTVAVLDTGVAYADHGRFRPSP